MIVPTATGKPLRCTLFVCGECGALVGERHAPTCPRFSVEGTGGFVRILVMPVSEHERDLAELSSTDDDD